MSTPSPAPDCQARAAFLRDLGHSLRGIRDFATCFPDDRSACALFLRLAHGSRCPNCQSKEVGLRIWFPERFSCDDCGLDERLTDRTPLAGTHLSLRLWLAAVWHVLVDTETISGAAFARRHGVRRRQTGWRLLQRVRGACIRPTARESGLSGQVLGRDSAANTAFVTVSGHDATSICAVLSEEACPRFDRPNPVAALFLGRLRCWIADIYRGVTRRYLDGYLAELVARFHRVQSLSPAVKHAYDW